MSSSEVVYIRVALWPARAVSGEQQLAAVEAPEPFSVELDGKLLEVLQQLDRVEIPQTYIDTLLAVSAGLKESSPWRS